MSAVGEEALLASVVISTFNRSTALEPTLSALARQDVPPQLYEVIVVDDGSVDDTQAVLSAIRVPYPLLKIRLDTNQGVSAGRNRGMSAARGRFLILLSDDLVVSENFVSEHARTLERFPNSWVVGGFKQLEELGATPFGRYLDLLERQFEKARLAAPVAPHIWELWGPTARNLSLPRVDLQRVGLFDEQFRVTCEDQDLGQRAAAAGIRFLYNEEISCIHNDHAADLRRYCRFQERGATDTVRLCHKHPEVHGRAAVVRANGPVSRADPAWLVVKKLAKSALARRPVMELLFRGVRAAEWSRVRDRVLFRAYAGLIGLAMFRGWRRGLEERA